MTNSKSDEEKYLNHGDICNEIEAKLGLYDQETGNDLIYLNSAFSEELVEKEKMYLKEKIAKKPIWIKLFKKRSFNCQNWKE